MPNSRAAVAAKAAQRTARLPNTYKGFPHGMPTTNADTINADLLAFNQRLDIARLRMTAMGRMRRFGAGRRATDQQLAPNAYPQPDK